MEMTDEEFRRYQITTDINNKFFKKRDKLVKEVYGDGEGEGEGKVEEVEDPEAESDRPVWMSQALRRQKQDEVVDPNEEVENEFFDNLKSDPKINYLEKKLDIFSANPTTFNEIFDNLDQLIENAPLSIRKVISNHTETGNDNFKPQ